MCMILKVLDIVQLLIQYHRKGGKILECAIVQKSNKGNSWHDFLFPSPKILEVRVCSEHHLFCHPCNSIVLLNLNYFILWFITSSAQGTAQLLFLKIEFFKIPLFKFSVWCSKVAPALVALWGPQCVLYLDLLKYWSYIIIFSHLVLWLMISYRLEKNEYTPSK